MTQKNKELLRDLTLIIAVIALYAMFAWLFLSVFASGFVAKKDLCGKRESTILVFRADMFCR